MSIEKDDLFAKFNVLIEAILIYKPAIEIKSSHIQNHLEQIYNKIHFPNLNSNEIKTMIKEIQS